MFWKAWRSYFANIGKANIFVEMWGRPWRIDNHGCFYTLLFYWYRMNNSAIIFFEPVVTAPCELSSSLLDSWIFAQYVSVFTFPISIGLNRQKYFFSCSHGSLPHTRFNFLMFSYRFLLVFSWLFQNWCLGKFCGVPLEWL